MNSISKRILSILLVVVMCLTMLPATALAADATYDLWVGGEQFTSEKLTIADSNGGTAKFDPVSNTLTLTNYNFTGAGYDSYNIGEYAAIYYEGSDTLNLVLEGTSSVTQQSTSRIDDSYGIFSVNGSITVSGNGSLTAKGSDATDRSCGVYIGGDDFIVSGGKLTANGGTANDQSWGLYACGSINISDGTIEANSGSADESVAMEADIAVTVSGGSITATGGDAGSESYGILVYENITVLDGNIEAIGGDAGSESYGVWLPKDITISGGTVEAISGTASISFGMMCLGNITISNTGSLTVKGGAATGGMIPSAGVSADRGITVLGGRLEAVGESYGVYNGFSDITILGGETVAQGKTKAFYSRPIVDSAFKYAAVWAGTDEFSAIMAGERPIGNLGFLYSNNYVKIAEGTPTATYTVETYTMGTDGEYGEPATETKTAAVGSAVSVTPENKQGFDVNAVDSILNCTVAEDGSTVLKVYYNRNQYPVTFNAGEGTFAGGKKEITIAVYFGAIPTAPETPALAGYTFAHWDPALAPVTVEGATYWAQFCDHSDSEHTTATDNKNGTHSFTCTVCGNSATEAHTGGTATCTDKAVCTVCGEPYGELDRTNHDETVSFDANGFCPNGCYEPALLNSDGYYEIGNAGQLFWFAQQVNGGNGSINGKLTDDIDLESRAWTPITNFSGTFDGAGFEIRNFAMNITGKGDYGLFGFVKDATIKNFTIYGEVESTLTASPGEEFKYGVIGDAEGSTIITDIHSYVNFTINDSNDRKFVGGILGRANNAGAGFTIERCSFSGKMNLGSAYVDCTGGIVAYVFAGNTANLNNCLFDGEIISEYNSTMQVGGMIGYYRGGDLTIKNCLSVGKIDVPNTTFAGMIGGRVLEMGTNISKVSNNYYYGTLPAFSDTENTSHSNYNKDMADYAGYGDGNARSVTDAQLKSGEVAYLLQGEQETHVWGQTIGTDLRPVLNGEKVYQVQNCEEETAYSNTNENIDHVWENGTCTVCGTPDPNYVVEGRGDINGDGKINAVDVNLLVRILAGVVAPNEEQLKAADIDSNGSINGGDSNALARILAGLN